MWNILTKSELLIIQNERSEVSTLSLRSPKYNDTIAILQRQVAMLQAQLNRELPENGSELTRVPKTGQTISYRLGDDGDFQSGVSTAGERFQDNGDGTLLDVITGIVWLGVRHCIVKHNWAGAIDYANTLSANSDLCPALTDGSQAGDWRLPNIKELQSLVDLAHQGPAWAPTIPFSGNWAEYPWSLYWSSNSFVLQPNLSGWAIDGMFGRNSIHLKGELEYAWPVRLESKAP